MAPARVVIIGGGISGLATAFYLSKLGLRSIIVEKSNRLGGLIQTESIAGCQLEAGPDSYLAAKPSVTELADELGDLKTQIIGSNDERRRIFIVRNGNLVVMPKGMVMIAPTEWKPVLSSELFNAKTKMRFLTEAFASPRHRHGDVSVAQLVTDHFGEEVLRYVAEPLLSGIYGGDSQNLSAESVLPRFIGYERRYGSLIKGVRRERHQAPSGSIFLSFRGGMQSLTDALARAIAPSTDILMTEATQVDATTNGWRIRLGDTSIEADQVVLACPAHAGAKLVDGAVPALASELAAIPYSSAILATLVYSRSTFTHPLDGFGFLVPKRERRTISAATWVSTKLPSRVPGHLAVLRGFIIDPEATQILSASPQNIAELVHSDFERLMHIHAAPTFASVHAWPASMPQYLVGHGERVLRIAAATSNFRGLHLVGNAFGGVGIPDCVTLAKQTAKRIHDAR